METREIGYLFDWDGVVVDSSAQHEESWNQLAAKEDLPLFDGHFKRGFGKRNEVIIPEILGWTDDPAEIAWLGNEKEKLYREIVSRSGLLPLPGVRAFLDSLVASGGAFAVGSSTPRENILAVTKAIGLDGYFQDIVAAADVSRGKPAPEVFLKAADLIGIAPENCVVFEDSFSGIEAGLAGGMKVVALATTNPPGELERTGAHLVANSFEQFGLERIHQLWE